MDDGSKDDPYTVIKPYVNDKIKYIKLDKNKGYSAAKNVGIRASTGSLIVVLDADDMLAPEKFESQIAGMKINNASIIEKIQSEFNDLDYLYISTWVYRTM